MDPELAAAVRLPSVFETGNGKLPGALITLEDDAPGADP